MNLQLTRRRELLEALKASNQTREVQYVRELLHNLLAETKDRLVRCPPTDIHRMQGEAQGYQRVLDLLDRPTAAENIVKEVTHG